MRFKPKYFLLFKGDLNEKIKWPERWGNTCRANVAPMLQEVLKVKTIGSELKLIWNDWHAQDMCKKYEINYHQLMTYIKADCGSLHFTSVGTRKRAIKVLENMGATGLVLVDSYKDLLLYQIHFHTHGIFPELKNENHEHTQNC